MCPKFKFALALSAVALLPALAVRAEEPTRLKLVAQGAIEKIGSHRAQFLTLTSARPLPVRKIPAGIAAPLYGVLSLGDSAMPTKITVLLDESDPKPRLFVDSNGDGDLTNDPPAVWEPKPYDADHKMSSGGASVQIEIPDGTLTVRLTMYRYDKTDPNPRLTPLRDKIIYYGDYAREGMARIGGKIYRAMLVDTLTRGDFRGIKPPPDTEDCGVHLYLDVNGNGVFDRTGEIYDIAKPFNIAGTTYEIKNMRANGSVFEIVKSNKTAAEILPPPNLSKGRPSLAFSAKTMDGKTVRFPDDFRGKIILLDFWATNNAPYLAALPDLVKSYNTYHSQNFEILGVSLDPKDAADKVAAFAKDNGMVWAEIYDGKYWAAAVAQKYHVESLPQAYLVDGDTGQILAENGDLRGAALEITLKSAIDKKNAGK